MRTRQVGTRGLEMQRGARRTLSSWLPPTLPLPLLLLPLLEPSAPPTAAPAPVPTTARESDRVWPCGLREAEAALATAAAAAACISAEAFDGSVGESRPSLGCTKATRPLAYELAAKSAQTAKAHRQLAVVLLLLLEVLVARVRLIAHRCANDTTPTTSTKKKEPIGH